MSKKYYVTAEGLEKLKDKLLKYKHVFKSRHLTSFCNHK